MNNKIEEALKIIIDEISLLDDDNKIDTLNMIKSSLHKISPINEPIDCVLWEKIENIQANEYNPNQVAGPEMKLLYESIKSDGYTQPVVTYKMDTGNREIVDGFHRNRICNEHKDIYKRTFGRLPVTTIDKEIDERIGSTIRHNRARGTHKIKSMSGIVLELVSSGWTDEYICKKLGMSFEEVLRLKQITGLKEAFGNHEFSRSWEEYESNFEDRKDTIS